MFLTPIHGVKPLPGNKILRQFCKSDKSLPEKTFLAIKNKVLLPTAVEERDGFIVARAYDASGKTGKCDFKSAWDFIGKADAAGNPSDHPDIRPYEIFELKFKNL